MDIDVNSLQKDSIRFDYYLPRVKCERIEHLIQFEPQGMHCIGELRSTGQEIKLSGTYQVKVTTLCDWCAEELSRLFTGEVDILLQAWEERHHIQGDEEINANDIDIDYFSTGRIDLDQIFEDQFLLDYPLIVTCSDNCKGLCPQCGTNLNHSSCECHGSNQDNPFSILKKLQH